MNTLQKSVMPLGAVTALVAFLLPIFTSAAVINGVGFIIDDSSSQRLYMATSTPTNWRVGYGYTNVFYTNSYAQLHIYFDAYDSEVCTSVTGPTALNDTAPDVYTYIALTGKSSITEVDIDLSDSSTTDGNGCFSGTNRYINIPLAPTGAEAIYLGVPNTGTTTINYVTGATSTGIYDQSSFWADLYLYLVAVFFASLMLTIWIWQLLVKR